MKKSLLYLLSILLIVACSEKENFSSLDNPDAVELKGIEAEVMGGVSTRAAALDAYNYVGRNAFVNEDIMVLTKIARTSQPIDGFTYSDIEYKQEIETGQTSGGWNRDKTKGYTVASTTVPERIYWSDAVNPHTYIGYCVPQQATGTTFDWNVKDATYEGAGTTGIPVYYGSLGDPAQLQTENGGVIANYIDYTNDEGETPVADVDEKGNATGYNSYKTGNEKIKRDDLLLTYANDKVAETGGSVAKLYFHHALAMVRVVVNIQGFSASTDAEDSKSVVTDMILKNMLTLYKWRQLGNDAEALVEEYDKTNVNAIYNSGSEGTVKFDQKKDVHLWIPRPLGTGSGVGKQFTFYGLAVPCTMGVNNPSTEQVASNLNFEFKVTYPDPMSPSTNITKTYKAMMPNAIVFRAGYCTTINITLNHNNEEMTVGAEYMDWQNVETPDEGELKKNSNFLTYIPTDDTDRKAKKIYIADDTQATEDDALWLYKTTIGGQEAIVDIYGNDGTLAHPYVISTANQLLSFAYEVKSGRTFQGKYVKLDADIVMQPTVEMKYDEGEGKGFYTTISTNEETGEITKNYDATRNKGITWIGIGDNDHAFLGTFDGGGRNISFIKGAPLFYKLGQLSVVDKVSLSNILQIDGNGAIANENFEGLICCCNVDGDIKGNATSGYWGSIVGNNTKGLIVGCSHVGKVIGNASATAVSGLVGYNSGSIIACYHSGFVTGGENNVYAAIGDYDDSSSYAISCYFNKDQNTQDYTDLQSRIPHVAFPLTTDVMQKEKFVNGSEYIYTNGHTHDDWREQHYSLNKALEAFVEKLAAVETEEGQVKTFLTLSLSPAGRLLFLNHFATKSEGSTSWKLRDDHKFKYTPGAYPKVQ